MRIIIKKFVSLGMLLLAMIGISTNSLAATINVNSLDDDGDSGNGNCNFREAVGSANINSSVDACTSGDPGLDTINFSVSGTIVLDGMQGEINVDAGEPIEINGTGIVIDNSANANRVLNLSANSDINGMEFLRGASTADGGTIYVNPGVQVIMNGGKITGVGAANSLGGAIYLDNGSKITLSGVEISAPVGDGVTNFGGAVYVGEGAELITNSGTVLQGSSINSGGAVYVDLGGSINMQDTVIQNSFAVNEGGGIAVANDAVNIEMQNVNFLNNGKNGLVRTKKGGGASFGQNVNVTMQSVQFVGNEAEDDGGAINMETGSSLLINSGGNLFQNNAVTVDRGGAMSFKHGVNNVTLFDVVFDGNSAINEGGAINFDGLTVANFQGCTFLNNAVTSGDGGAVAVKNGASLSAVANIFSGNTASGNGGSLFALAGNLNGIDGIFTGNGVLDADNGGAIYVNSGDLNISDTSTFNNFVANLNGGAVYVLGSALAVIGGQFSQNQAGNDGGAVFGANISSPLELVSSIFSDNVAGNSGGAIRVVNSEFRDNSGTGGAFSGNFAGWRGGAIAIDNALNALISEISNRSFVSNSSNNGGGAIFVENGGTIKMNDVEVSNNEVLVFGQGGGVYTTNLVTTEIENSLFDGNIAVGKGGGVSSSLLTIKNSTVRNNSVNFAEFLGGGGIYAEDGLNMEGVTVNNNNSLGNGGGVVASGGNLEILNSTLTSNIAQGFRAGGMYFQNIFGSVKFSTISHNSVDGDGGGVVVGFNGDVEFEGNIFSDNSALNGTDCYFDGFGINAVSLGYNLIGDNSGCNFTASSVNDILGGQANLGPLQNNGGATMTRALTVGSQAFNAYLGTNAPIKDQRGINRPFGTFSDIGAFESAIDLTPPAPPQPPENNSGGAGGAGGAGFGQGPSMGGIPFVPQANADSGGQDGNEGGQSGQNGGQDSSTQSGQGQSGDGQGEEKQSGQGQSGDGQGGEKQSGQGQSGDGQGGEKKSGQGKSGVPKGSINKIKKVNIDGGKNDGGQSGQVESVDGQGGGQDEIFGMGGPGEEVMFEDLSDEVSSQNESVVETLEGNGLDEEELGLSANEDGFVNSEELGANLIGGGNLYASGDEDYDAKLLRSFLSGICPLIKFEDKFGLYIIRGGDDSDSDGLSDAIECELGTNPFNIDSDGDGILDYEEVLELGTNPVIADAEEAGKRRNGVWLINPEMSQTTSDRTPFFKGVAVSNSVVEIYIAKELDDYVFEVAENGVVKEKNQEDLAMRSEKLKFELYGTTMSSSNGVFVLDGEKEAKDALYIAYAVAKKSDGSEARSQLVEFAVSQKNAVYAPKVRTIGEKKVDDEVILKGLKIEIRDNRPIVSGQTEFGNKVSATWKSTISSSMVLTDSASGEFAIKAPNELEPGDHKVFLNATRGRDNSVSETVVLSFRIANWIEKSWWVWALTLVGILGLSWLGWEKIKRSHATSKSDGLNVVE